MTVPTSLPPNASGTFQHGGTRRSAHRLRLWRAQGSQGVNEI